MADGAGLSAASVDGGCGLPGVTLSGRGARIGRLAERYWGLANLRGRELGLARECHSSRDALQGPTTSRRAEAAATGSLGVKDGIRLRVKLAQKPRRVVSGVLAREPAIERSDMVQRLG